MSIIYNIFPVSDEHSYQVYTVYVLWVPMHQYPSSSTKISSVHRETVTDIGRNIRRISWWWKKLCALVNHSCFCLHNEWILSQTCRFLKLKKHIHCIPNSWKSWSHSNIYSKDLKISFDIFSDLTGIHKCLFFSSFTGDEEVAVVYKYQYVGIKLHLQPRRAIHNNAKLGQIYWGSVSQSEV